MRKAVFLSALAAAVLAWTTPFTTAQAGEDGTGKININDLIKELRQGDSTARGIASDALGKMGKPAVEPLLGLLKDGSKHIRSSAAQALGDIGDASAVPPLMEALKDDDESVRAESAWALGKIGDERAGEPLKQGMESAGKKEFKVCYAFGLARIAGDKKALQFIISSLRDKNDTVRFRAAWASGLLGDPKTRGPLKKGWKSEGQQTAKIAFAFGMAMVPRAPEALDFIIQKQDDDDDEVSRHAGRALYGIIRGRLQDLQTGKKDSRKKAALDLCEIGAGPAEDEVIDGVMPLLSASDKDTRAQAVFTFG